jgi:hypothetical protein
MHGGAERTLRMASDLNGRVQMPVTAKLSRRFYERFGDEITNELVDWFNSVDATYQASLRELNEINFARFDAKLEQRIAILERGFAQHGEAMTTRIGAFESRMLRWMIALWTGTILTMVGLFMALLQLR